MLASLFGVPLRVLLNRDPRDSSQQPPVDATLLGASAWQGVYIYTKVVLKVSDRFEIGEGQNSKSRKFLKAGKATEKMDSAHGIRHHEMVS